MIAKRHDYGKTTQPWQSYTMMTKRHNKGKYTQGKKAQN